MALYERSGLSLHHSYFFSSVFGSKFWRTVWSLRRSVPCLFVTEWLSILHSLMSHFSWWHVQLIDMRCTEHSRLSDLSRFLHRSSFEILKIQLSIDLWRTWKNILRKTPCLTIVCQNVMDSALHRIYAERILRWKFGMRCHLELHWTSTWSWAVSWHSYCHRKTTAEKFVALCEIKISLVQQFLQEQYTTYKKFIQ